MLESLWCDRVLRIRTALGLTQAKLASKLGLHEMTIIHWERAARRPYSREAELFERLEKRLEERPFKVEDDEAWRELVDG